MFINDPFWIFNILREPVCCIICRGLGGRLRCSVTCFVTEAGSSRLTLRTNFNGRSAELVSGKTSESAALDIKSTVVPRIIGSGKYVSKDMCGATPFNVFKELSQICLQVQSLLLFPLKKSCYTWWSMLLCLFHTALDQSIYQITKCTFKTVSITVKYIVLLFSS